MHCSTICVILRSDAWKVGELAVGGLKGPFALTMPIVTLILATFARNKVEGLAIFKGLNLLMMLPAFSLFIDSAAKFFFAPVPLFWTFQFLSSAEAGAPAWGMFTAGIGLHLALLYGYTACLGKDIGRNRCVLIRLSPVRTGHLPFSITSCCG